MVNLMHILTIFSCIDTKKLGEELLMESFEDLDSEDVWVKGNGTIYCTNRRVNACAVSSGRNYGTGIYHQKSKGEYTETTYLELWLYNECDDRSAGSLCCNAQRCTDWTTANLFTHRYYGYGMYVYIARAVPSLNIAKEFEDRAYADAHAVSCFSLKQARCKICDFNAAMCFSTKVPRKIQLTYRFENTHWKRFIELGYDASEKIGVYAFDYDQTRLSFLVNEIEIARVQMEKMPRRPIQIDISLLPLDSDIGFLPRTVAKAVEVFRVAYRRNKLGVEKTYAIGRHDEELFYMDSKGRTRFIIITSSFIAIFALTLLIFYGIFECEMKSEHTYTLIVDIGNSLM